MPFTGCACAASDHEAYTAKEPDKPAPPLLAARAYGTDFRLFREWCDAKGVSALPAGPETVAAYLAAEARTARPSTIGPGQLEALGLGEPGNGLALSFQSEAGPLHAISAATSAGGGRQ
jgi:hypothetical protein